MTLSTSLGAAFLHFRRSGCECVVLETGLGGRLDSTNIVQPELSVITSIGLEHTRILGDTIEKIAGEKAGIMKGGCPVLVGPNCPEGVMRGRARDVGAMYHEVYEGQGSNSSSSIDDIELDFDFDVQNGDIARRAIEILKETGGEIFKRVEEEHIKEGTGRRPPCR